MSISNRNKKKVIFVQRFNDYTGSSRVLAQVIEKQEDGIEGYLLTSKGEGCLSGLSIQKIYLNSKNHSNRYLRFIFLLFGQFVLFFRLLSIIPQLKVEEVYINTILPFGAALAAWIMRRKVIYHVHETAVRPKFFQFFLLKVIELTAKEVIYVSNYSATALAIPKVKKRICYNQLSTEFMDRAKAVPQFKHEGKILMLASLNKYKGLNSFLKLADICPEYQFELVLSADQIRIDSFFEKERIPKNVKIYDRQEDVHPFYQSAAILLNLSNPNYWVESFGMTILEAGIYARPAIAPPIGGPKELIIDGESGFLVEPSDIENIKVHIYKLLGDQAYYEKIAHAAYLKAVQIQSYSFPF